MAGHSKFKNIMHRKGRQDAMRSKLFSKLSKEITVAVKIGGGVVDPTMNSRLRLAIQNAKGQSMPKENVQRAINKGVGNDGNDYKEMRYEGYGPGGIAIIVEVLTENLNRSASNIRSYFSKHGGQMGETGSVSFLFKRIGEIIYRPDANNSEENVMEAAITAGAEDVVFDDIGGHRIICAFENLSEAAKELENMLGEAESVQPSWQPQNSTPINEEKAEKILKLLDVLEEDDDVQNVYSNFIVKDHVIKEL